MELKDYDTYKLTTPDYYDSDLELCELCDEVFHEDDIQEFTYKDADGDRQTRFICPSCIDKINQGEY